MPVLIGRSSSRIFQGVHLGVEDRAALLHPPFVLASGNYATDDEDGTDGDVPPSASPSSASPITARMNSSIHFTVVKPKKITHGQIM